MGSRTGLDDADATDIRTAAPRTSNSIANRCTDNAVPSPIEAHAMSISFTYSRSRTYLATTVTNQNLILEEIKRRLNSGNEC
jgi:hypothetical protein